MFVDLPKNLSIYAISAANPTESSWGYYCSPDDKVNGKHIGSCLGDLFSINWMEDADAADSTAETLQQQFEIVKKKTSKSHVMQWGSLDFTSDVTGTYIGTKCKKQSILSKILGKIKSLIKGKKIYQAIDSRYAKLYFFKAKYEREPTKENEMLYKRELNSIAYFNKKFELIAEKFGVLQNFRGIKKVEKVTNYECLKTLVGSFQNTCGRLSEFALQYVNIFAEICQREMYF